MMKLISIEENLLAPSNLPIDIALKTEEGKTIKEGERNPKIKSKAKAKETKIARPAKEKRGAFKKRKDERVKLQEEDFETVDEGSATVILGDVYINRLYLECDSPKGPMDIEVAREDFIIGKDPDADATIAFDPAISRKHCKISYIEERYFLEDLGSSNGTYLNKQCIEDEVMMIQDGDKIRLGNQVFLVKER